MYVTNPSLSPSIEFNKVVLVGSFNNSFRYSVGGYHTTLSRLRPGFESRYRKAHLFEPHDTSKKFLPGSRKFPNKSSDVEKRVKSAFESWGTTTPHREVCMWSDAWLLRLVMHIKSLLPPRYIEAREWIKSQKWLFVQPFITTVYRCTMAIADAIMYEIYNTNLDLSFHTTTLWHV
jgi:hypothetical protein